MSAQDGNSPPGQIHWRHCSEHFLLMQAPHTQVKLPLPDDASLAHSRVVADFIRQQIVNGGGAIGFAEFMHHALYAPGLGYYAAGATKFGAAGDFVTAPEISPIFGRILARQIAGVFDQMSSVERNVLEFGAGSGVLAATILAALLKSDRLPEHYFILEVSADLQERQSSYLSSALPELFERIVWLKALPESFAGVLIANEVIDALPTERFSKQKGRVCRQAVRNVHDGFAWQLEPASALLERAVQSIETRLGYELPDGYTSEISLGASSWLQDLANCTREGVLFLFDYGVSLREYYAADRSDGWLRCHFRHHAHSNPLIYPGIQDLTSWVNFSQIAEVAVERGLRVEGYVTQAQFMLYGGLQEEMQEFASLPTAAQMELSSQIKVLMLPGEMGENVKCIGLSKGSFSDIACMTRADRAHTL